MHNLDVNRWQDTCTRVSLTCLALKPTAVVWRNEPEKLEGDLAGDGGRCIPTHVGVRGAIVSITLRARLWLSS